MSRDGWSQKLPPRFAPLKTLSDIRALLLNWEGGDPPHTWQTVGRLAFDAAKTGDLESLIVSLDILRVHAGGSFE